MIQHDATSFEYPVRQLAAAWRSHAQRHGVSDPDTQLIAREAITGNPQAGYRPAWFSPMSGELVTILACEPHRTQQDAIAWLAGMLGCLHANGNICLYLEESA